MSRSRCVEPIRSFARGLAFGLALFIAWVPSVDSDERLQTSDFSYVGAFSVEGDFESDPRWNAYGMRGMTFDPSGDPSNSDAYPGSLWITGHDWMQWVFEISIPTPSLGSPEYSELPRPVLLTEPFLFTDGCSGSENRLAGLEIHANRLWASCAYSYNVSGADLPAIMWSRKLADMSDPKGPYHAGPTNSALFHANRQGNYLFSIPSDWAAKYVGSRTLATGFSRNSHGGQQGPTILAFDPENPADGYPLLYYRQLHEHPNCFADQSTCDFPEYTACDKWESVSWVRSGSRDAVLMSGRKCDGGKSTYQSGGWECGPCFGEIIFYDPADFEASLEGKGRRKPWTVVPYHSWRPSELVHAEAPLGGMAYDESNSLLYFVEQFAGPGGRAIIHVYRVLSATE
jgi:hypothetical protein